MQSVNGSMKQGDCVQLLKSFGFTDPVLVSHSDQTYTYKFNDYAPKQLLNSLGEPTIAGGGKVAVYQVPNVAKLGVSPTNSMVRLIDLTVKGGVSKGHIKIDKLPGPLGTAYLRASGDPTIRVAFIKKLWDHLNRAKFQVRMAPPKLIVGEISEKGVRAFYQRGSNYTPGTIKVAPFLFNAREPFFVEIFLHEMCHQAAWCISHSSDNSERGHGPVWQQWMVDVGLDPRRFDPTDSSEYSLNTPRASEDEARFTRTYGGPRLPDAVIDKAEKAKKLKNHREGPCTIILQGRILDGTLSGNVFTGKNRSTERQVSLRWGSSGVGNEIFYELST